MEPDRETRSHMEEQVRLALAEDIGDGDLTGLLIPPDKILSGTIRSREQGVLCGTAWVSQVFAELDQRISIDWVLSDGAALAPDSLICTLHGPARSLMTGERSALNFLQLLSAVASETRKYVLAVAHTSCKILDTRKTIPGLRLAEKYAVRCGGGTNHRKGLYDGILIKENHIAAAGSIAAAVGDARRIIPGNTKVEVEVETLAQLEEALDSRADIILLDNFGLPDMAEAVQRTGGRCQLEASGNITLENIAAVASTGVDFISVGALTKNVRALDLTMLVDN